MRIAFVILTQPHSRESREFDMEAIRLAALGINLAIWAIVGFICWIPLLARTTASLAAAVLVSTISRSDPSHLKLHFENAVSFYSRGFDTIFRVLGSERTPSWSADETKSPGVQWEKVLLELGWTVFFWASVVMSTYGFFNWVAT